MPKTITITEEQLATALLWHLEGFHKDISDGHHDVREYERLNKYDAEEVANGLFESLSE